jgi:hypothetical protein
VNDDKSKSRNVGTNVHANDHMTVKHIQTGLATSEGRTQQTQQREMTTAHLSNALSQPNKPQVSADKPMQSVPSAPASKSSEK